LAVFESETDGAIPFRALVESLADHVFIIDGSGRYLYSNQPPDMPACPDGAGLVGRTVTEVFPPEISGRFLAHFNRVCQSGQAVSFEYQSENTDTGGRCVSTVLFPIRLPGRRELVGGLSRDVTKQKDIEKQLVQSQKMEALGTLVAGVAHEINNPINLIIFNLPLIERVFRDFIPVLQRHLEGRSDQRFGGLPFNFLKENLPKLILDTKMAADRVARIVTGLKDFAQKSNPAEKKPVQVNKAVENAIRLAGATLRNKKADLNLNLAPDLPLIVANLQNLEQVVLNLVINAFQAIDHDRGRVEVETRVTSSKDAVQVVVRDNGRGINPRMVKRIFDPFATDRQTDGGTGLGLSVSYNLVKAHNGHITFETEQGKGTTFTVNLPLESPYRLYRVMVVDDDAAFRKMLKQAIVRSIQCEVEAVSSGAEALIRLGSDPPDALVLDMFMPEIDGLDICRAIKNELGLERTKVLIITGFPHHPNLAEAARMGFTMILHKPLNLMEFIGALKGCLHGKCS